MWGFRKHKESASQYGGRVIREQNEDENKKTLAKLTDANYVATELACELGLYQNYKTEKYVYGGVSFPTFDIELLARDLRANAETKKREKRLAPLRKEN